MSSIKQKMGVCPDCKGERIVPVIAGRCQFHYKIFRGKINKDKRDAKNLSNGIDNQLESTKLQAWFLARMKEMTGRCMECGEPLNKNVYKYAICSIAHVLAKRDNMYPSVKYHPDNWIELGATCGCHDKFDKSNWNELREWKILPIIVLKIQILRPLLNEKETNKLDNFITSLCQETP